MIVIHEFTYRAAPLTDPLACLTDFDGNGEADRDWDFCDAVQNETEARYSISALNAGTHLGESVSLIGDVDGDELMISWLGIHTKDALDMVKYTCFAVHHCRSMGFVRLEC